MENSARGHWENPGIMAAACGVTVTGLLLMKEMAPRILLLGALLWVALAGTGASSPASGRRARAAVLGLGLGSQVRRDHRNGRATGCWRWRNPGKPSGMNRNIVGGWIGEGEVHVPVHEPSTRYVRYRDLPEHLGEDATVVEVQSMSRDLAVEVKTQEVPFVGSDKPDRPPDFVLLTFVLCVYVAYRVFLTPYGMNGLVLAGSPLAGPADDQPCLPLRADNVSTVAHEPLVLA